MLFPAIIASPDGRPSMLTKNGSGMPKSQFRSPHSQSLSIEASHCIKYLLYSASAKCADCACRYSCVGWNFGRVDYEVRRCWDGHPHPPTRFLASPSKIPAKVRSDIWYKVTGLGWTKSNNVMVEILGMLTYEARLLKCFNKCRTCFHQPNT